MDDDDRIRAFLAAITYDDIPGDFVNERPVINECNEKPLDISDYPIEHYEATCRDDDVAKVAKKPPRLSWTPKLESVFCAAVEELEKDNPNLVKPKAIWDIMASKGYKNVTPLQITSHLQKYREKRKKKTGKDATSKDKPQEISQEQTIVNGASDSQANPSLTEVNVALTLTDNNDAGNIENRCDSVNNATNYFSVFDDNEFLNKRRRLTLAEEFDLFEYESLGRWFES